MFVTERYTLPDSIVDMLRAKTPNFGFNGYGETIFYTRYSRTKNDQGEQEDWCDCVIRVVEGVLSIRKDWYLKNHITWDQDFWDDFAVGFSEYLYDMKFLPPGRGLWAMGTEFVFERGSMALQNCGFTIIGDDIGKDIYWVMDALMCGVGVGFQPERNEIKVYRPLSLTEPMVYRIADSREGWCEATKILIDSYLQPNHPTVEHDYSLIRPEGLPIKGFGGISSGPGPLIELHRQIREFFELYLTQEWYDSVILKTDLANAVGCAVIAGNVRRSAEIACGNIHDHVFLDLKNYDKYPHRKTIGWMSNNSAILSEPDDYLQLGEIARRVIKNGEPGIINRVNMVKGRVGKFNDNVVEDRAIGFNPCGEQPLENKELCCLVETVPNRCTNSDGDFDLQVWLNACKYATFYASTVTLLPTHHQDTNQVMIRNRRIGVSIMGYTTWVVNEQQHRVINHLREGYKVVREHNRFWNHRAGIPESIRVTTVKPGGTTPKLAGEVSGMSFKNFEYMIRRHRQATNSSLSQALIEAGVPYEKDVASANTLVFEFPLHIKEGKASLRATVWEQAHNLMTLQREWSDNAVSNTLNFKPAWPLVELVKCSTQVEANEALKSLSAKYGVDFYSGVKYNENYEFNGYRATVVEAWGNFEARIFKYDPTHEEDDVELVLSMTVPHCKSLSLLPHSPLGVYAQMPEEGISKEEYEERLSKIDTIAWSTVRNIVAQPETYCTSESCELPNEKRITSG